MILLADTEHHGGGNTGGEEERQLVAPEVLDHSGDADRVGRLSRIKNSYGLDGTSAAEVPLLPSDSTFSGLKGLRPKLFLVLRVFR
jgi:hypothetical protein